MSLVEGSITTPDDAERIRAIRQASARLVTIGACATSGGIQALRNYADVAEYTAAVYAHPEYISTLGGLDTDCRPCAVDFELHGCPINRRQLLEVISAYLAGRRRSLPGTACARSARREALSASSSRTGLTCLGPVTSAGLRALCPAVDRGCYGCFGPVRNR